METMKRDLVSEQPLALYLDEAVEEVFRMMMGVSCLPAAEPPVEERETITAVIGLAGSLSGACVLRAGQKVALCIAEMLVGMEMPAIDDTVKDAIGEVCNMLAGAWKGKSPDYSSNCMLSVPAVVTGRDYHLHLQKPEFRVDHLYTFGAHTFSLCIICDSIL